MIILKVLIFILFIIVSVIVAAIIMLLHNQDEDINTNVNSILDNNVIQSNNTTSDNTINDNTIIDNNISNNTTNENNIEVNDTLERNKLVKQTESNTYCLIKTCLYNYYSLRNRDIPEESEEQAINYKNQVNPIWNYIDDEAKQKLKLDMNNISLMDVNLEYSMFAIDEILGQAMGQNKELYVVYYRINTEEKQVNSRVLFIKIDRKNKTFSIYPYEYLQMNNYINLKENDRVQIDNLNDIEKNEQNLYNTDNYEQKDLTNLIELYEKYKFDLYYDVEHLYNSLNEEYKNQNYGNYDEFNNFIETHRQELESDEMQKYRTADTNNGTELIGIGTSGRNYIFDMTNLTEYDVRLDGYSSVTEEYMKNYNMVLPEGKGRYSINRIFNAINEKNYKFLYDKLNDVQKQNYYPTYEEFVKFIQNNLFEENNAEILESGQNTATDVYQYLVEVKDLAGGNNHKIFTIVIFLGQNGDFKFGITN